MLREAAIPARNARNLCFKRRASRDDEWRDVRMINDRRSQAVAELIWSDARHASQDLREMARAGVSDIERDLGQAARRFAHELRRARDSLARHKLQGRHSSRLLEQASAARNTRAGVCTRDDARCPLGARSQRIAAGPVHLRGCGQWPLDNNNLTAQRRLHHRREMSNLGREERLT